VAAVSDAFNELQRAAATAETAAKLTQLFWDFDLLDLAPQLRGPALVLNAAVASRTAIGRVA
jgi:hypothetical protein